MALNVQLLNELLLPEIRVSVEREEDWIVKHAEDWNPIVDSTGSKFKLRSLGDMPEVIKGNQPLPYTPVKVNDTLSDVDLEIYRIPPIIIPSLEELETNGQKRTLVARRAAKNIINEVKKDGVYNIAPVTNTAATPVFPSTGTVVNGLKSFAEDDFLSLGEKMTDAGIVSENRWVAVNTKAFYQMVKTNAELKKMFREAKLANLEGSVFPLFGVNLLVSDYVPYYDPTGNKLPVGVAPVAGVDRMAAIAFVSKLSYGMGVGTIKTFATEDDPTYFSDIISFEVKAGVMPPTQKYLGAIYQGA